MVLPEYTDDKFWNDAIQQYGQHKNGIFLHPQIEYHIWMYFKSFLRRNNRYFLDSPILQLFASIFENHIYILKSGTVIYRARIDDDRSLEGDWMDYMDVKSTPEILDRLRRNKGDTEIYKQLVSDYENHINSDEYLRAKTKIESGFQGYDEKGCGAPPTDKARAGRCNLKGVSYLYAALEEHTAISEIRPNVSDSISVASLQPKRDLRLVDLDYTPGQIVKGEDFLFDDIRQEFSNVNKGKSDEYLATQYITALIEHIGYDGLRFRSSLVKNGTNYVIFNPSNCHIESSKLVLLTDVTYTYGQYK